MCLCVLYKLIVVTYLCMLSPAYKFCVNFGLLTYRTAAWPLHLLHETRNDTRHRKQDRPLFQQHPIRI